MKLLQRLGIYTPETKDVSGLAAFSDRDNFVTNRVTLATYMDSNASVLGLSATWACVNLIAGTIGSLPLMVYRTVDGQREIARDHPLYYVLHDSPNYDQTSLDFWEWAAASIELYGNSYVKIEKRGNGDIFSLTPLPKTTTARRLVNGDIEYSWTADGVVQKSLQGDILHIRGFGGDPLKGLSTIAACGRTFHSANATETMASTMFSNAARPSGILSTDKSMTGEQRALAEKLLTERFVGAMNAGRPMFLDNGVKWEQLSISPDDAELLESRKFSGEEQCRLFGVPPAMVGYGDKASNWGTGKEVDVLGFQKFTLRRRLKRIELALEKQLLSAKDRLEGITIEFNIEGLLRGDSEARAQFYKNGLNDGWLTINQVCRWENLPPVEGGDVNRVQMQNVPITDPVQGNENERV